MSAKRSLFLFISICITSIIFANEPVKDTLYTELKNDIVILSSTKETNSLKTLPASVSVFSQKNLESFQVHNLKDLSAFVPNYLVADYGSKMTAPIYIRGIGARSGTQTVSLYIDNIPYFNTTSFDNELYDIQRVEILRGTQGTLYGRNAMGGILNIYTYSPLDYQGTTVKVGAGNYGLWSADVSHFSKLNETIGIGASVYYKQDDGYFTNEFTGDKVDDRKNGGGRIRLAWLIHPNLLANYSVSYDYVDQGAFPYANVATGKIDYNSAGSYKRDLVTNGLSLRYKGSGYEINSTTGYQYLHDNMHMDQDYTRASMFRINQKQRENSLSQEIAIKSENHSDYQWSYGIYGFYDYLNTYSPVYMMKDGVATLQSVFDRLQIIVPGFPELKYTDDQIDLNSRFKRPIYGAAVFHQSTFNNILQTQGLSLTLGLRLDYEKAKLDYNAETKPNMTIKHGMMPFPVKLNADTSIVGKTSKDFLELLPKAVLKYQFRPQSYMYISASRGYKTGGHNIQIFADLLQEAMNAKIYSYMPTSSPADQTPVANRITFKPEYSWNYEVGGQINIIDNTLFTNFSLFYIDVKDVQITKFVATMGGRMVENAGNAVSKGFEAGLKVRPCKGFFLYGNYGFSDARFKDYVTTIKGDDGEEKEVDYSNNHIPFAPRMTLSLGTNISYDLAKSAILDRIIFDINYTRVGRIYWNEENSISEPDYDTVDTRLTFEKSLFALELWGRNIFDEEYKTFLFNSSGNNFAQYGKPARWGVSLKIKL